MPNPPFQGSCSALPDLGQAHARRHRLLVALCHEERDLLSEAGKLKKWALATAVREFAVLCARKLLEEDAQAALGEPACYESRDATRRLTLLQQSRPKSLPLALRKRT